MVYIFCLLVIITGVFIYDICHSKRGKSLWYVLEWLLMILIAGLRYKVGGDTYPIMDYYSSHPDLSHLTIFDFTTSRYPPLWVLFVSLIKTFSSKFYVFQIAHAIIINTAFFLFFKNNSKYNFTCILFYAVFLFFNYNTEIIRAALSVSVFLFSYDYLKNKEWIKYAIVVMLSIGFHAESLILLSFPLCHICKNNSFFVSIVGLFLVFVLMFSLDFIPVLSDALEFNETVQHALDAHSENLEFSYNLNGIIMYSFKIITWLLGLWLLRKDSTINRFFIYISLVSVVFSFKYPVIFGRAMDFIYPLLTVEIVNVMFSKRNALKYIFLLGVVYSWGMFYFWKVSGTFSYKQYFPYVSVFNPYEVIERNNVVYEYHSTF